MRTEELISKAILNGLSVYKDSDNKWIIKTSLKNREILFKEQKFNQWLLFSNEMPQAKLQINEISVFLKVIKKKSNSLSL